jgi:hypothetical protein
LTAAVALLLRYTVHSMCGVCWKYVHGTN